LHPKVFEPFELGSGKSPSQEKNRVPTSSKIIFAVFIAIPLIVNEDVLFVYNR
jgi:hypothetical protein